MQDHRIRRRISLALAAGLLGELFNKIAPLLIIKHAQAQLGVERFGQAQFAMGLIDMVIPFVTFGYTTLAAIEIGQNRDDKHAIGTLIGNVTLLRLANAAIVCLLLNAVVALVPRYNDYTHLVFVLSFMIITSAIDMLFVHAGTQRMAMFSILTVASKILSLFAIFLWVQNPEDYTFYAVISCAANSLISIGSAFYSARNFSVRWDTSQLRALFKNAVPYAFNIMLLTILFRFDLILAEKYGGAVGAGLYAGPSALMRSLISIIGAVGMVFFSELVVANSKEAFAAGIRQVFWILGALLFPIAFGIWFVDERLLVAVMGSSFADQGRVLSCLVVTVLVYGAFYILGFQALAVKKRIGVLNRALACSCAVGIALGLILGRSHGLLGIAMSLAIANIVGTVMCYLDVRTWMSLSLAKEIKGTIVPAMFMALALFALPTMPVVWTIAVGGLFYMAIFILLNVDILQSFYRDFIQKRGIEAPRISSK